MQVGTVIACADVKAIKVAFLVARQALSSITDKEGLRRHEAEIGTTSDKEMRALKVRLEWGRQKEALAIREMKNLIHRVPGQEDLFKDACILETGFTSCANGCALTRLQTTPSVTGWRFNFVLCNHLPQMLPELQESIWGQSPLSGGGEGHHADGRCIARCSRCRQGFISSCRSV
jgi:hypothetical protein